MNLAVLVSMTVKVRVLSSVNRAELQNMIYRGGHVVLDAS